jgi:putative ABC transport system permease protein
VVSRHKVGWSQAFPIHYADEVRKLPGIDDAMGGRWAELKYPANTDFWFATTAVEARPFVDMHYELEAPPEQKAAWIKNRRGALVSAELAQQFGWKLGDRIHFEGTFLPGEWDLEIACIVHSTRHGFGHRDVWLHIEYFNEAIPAEDRDQLNIISAKIGDPKQGANIARAIDIHFDERDNQTFTQEDQALNAAFVGMFGAILQAIDVVSVLVLGIILLLLGNTVAMGVRERTHEYGVLRAIGFMPKHLAAFVLGEATTLGLLGGLLGLLLAYPVVEKGLSRFVEEEMGMAPLVVPPDAAILAVLLGGLLGLVSACWPAYKAARLEVVDSLRRVG